MEKVKTVLLVIGNPTIDVSNQNNAVVTALRSIGDMLLAVGHEVYLNEFNLKELKEKESSGFGTPSKPSALKAALRSNLPKVYNTLVDYKYFKAVKAIEDRIVDKVKNIDAIFEFSAYGADVGLNLSRKFNVPLVAMYDAPGTQQFVECNGVASFYAGKADKIERDTMQHAQSVICYSQPVKDYLVKFASIDEKKVHIFPIVNWNKLEEKNPAFVKQRDKLVIGFIGSFMPWHKVDLLVNAIIAIPEHHDKISGVLIGKGLDWERVKNYIADAGLSDMFELPGFVTDDELLMLKSNMDIGVMPGSNWYGCPLKIQEYAYCKVPTIAPDTPTVSYLFKDEEHLLLIDPKDELQSLINQLKRLIENEELRNTLGENLYLHMKKEYAYDKFAELVERLISE